MDKTQEKIEVPSDAQGFEAGETYEVKMYGYTVKVQVVSPSWKDSEFILRTEIDGKQFKKNECSEPENWQLQEFLFTCLLQAVKDGARVVFP